MFVSLVPKLIIAPILLIEDVFRILEALVNFFINLFSSHQTRRKPLMEERRKFVSQIALGVASIPFAGLIHGMVKGKYNYKIHRVTLSFKDLPQAFDNFTITQLSDIHSGSFDDASEVLRGIKLANSQNSDILFFTGDLVNNHAKEMDTWMDTFSKLHAPFGKFSILGNHDYGDYSRWKSKEAKVRNLERLKTIHKELGFRLLLNENLKIEKEGQSITLIGVENWGKHGFARYGNLNKALTGVDDKSVKILLSHDPSHWDAEILKHEQHIHLTLSGHTHGMQFGVEIPGFKWSPVQYFYPEWAGLYKKQNKFLYVNRGFGFIGYPGRAGIFPEITVITLQKA
jgi:Predicted phosphohydrolases